MFKSIQGKIILLYSLLLLLAMQLIGVYMIQSLEQYYLNNYKSNIKAQGELLSSFIFRYLEEEEGAVYISDLVESFSGFDEVEITVLDRYGRRLINFEGEVSFQERIVQEEVIRALSGNQSEVIRVNPEDRQRYYYLALPIKSGQQVKGVVYLIGSLEKIDHTLMEIKMILLTGSAFVLGIAVFLGIILAQTIAGPIKEVTSKAARMAQGDFSQRIKVRSRDEIGQLGEMFNLLTRRLDETLSEISAEKSKVEAILNYMTDGIIALDKDGKIIHLNPAARRIFEPQNVPLGLGLPAQAVLGFLFNEQQLASLLKTSHPVTREVTLSTPSSRILQVHFAPFREKNDQLSGILVVLHDISKERELSRLQQEFVANVSHELRTPLTTIKSYIETLIGGAMDDPEVRENFLKVVESETDRMVNLVKDLLVLSQLDSRQVRWQKSLFSLEELFFEVKEQFKIKFPEQQLQIEMDIPEDTPPLNLDRDRVKQVLINIISNAIKYTPPGGKISIKVRPAEDMVNISVRDTGIGIPPDELPRVFERFYRVDKTRSRDYGGTGLGLSIAKEIVEAVGGRIGINSRLGEGTEVWFTLPVST